MTYFPAHIRIDDHGRKIVQSCQDHMNNTAKYAKEALNNIYLGETAYLAGIMHDCGKFTSAFTNYIERATRGESVRPGSVNHTFAGVKYLLEKYHGTNDSVGALTCEIVAYAIGAHHGLFDCFNEERESGFMHRCTKEDINYQEAITNYLQNYLSASEITIFFKKSVNEIQHIIEILEELLKEDAISGDSSSEDIERELNFYLGLLTRLILSAVINGDRRDTAEFLSGKERVRLNATKDLWHNTLLHMEKELDKINCYTDIEKARSALSLMCKEAAGKESGIYELNMPTGSGKTLSSLRYALSHAEKWNKKHIIFVTPLLSILDQNAAVIKKYIGDDNLILEHHSNIIRPLENTKEYDAWEYYTETWDAPIVITTMVQFLNTLFSGKMSCVRRMHSLCESIIVIDEVQTVPAKMLSLFSTATNFLHHVCNATIVLSSATQPGFNHLRYPMRGCKGDIADCDDKMRNIFRRTTITQLDSCTLEKSVPLFEDMLKKYNSMLIVCNKKDEARYLFKELHRLDCDVYHLSASMCIEHRKHVLENIKSCLDEITTSLKTSTRIDKKVVCISTQVIEAGVDLSFECAVRFTAGIDSIIQTAGRCNRSGEYGPSGDVYIFTCLDENLGRLEEIKKSKMATEELLADYRENSLRFQNRIDSLSAIDFYYKRFFRSFGEGYQEYSTKKHGTIYDLLSVNDSYTSIRQEKYDFLKQAFKTAGNEFKVFDTDALDVIVPYEEGADIISDLNSENASWNKDFVEKALEKAKQYTVSLYSYQVKKLENLGALYTILGERAVVLQSSYYDDYVGVVDEDRNYGYLEVST